MAPAGHSPARQAVLQAASKVSHMTEEHEFLRLLNFFVVFTVKLLWKHFLGKIHTIKGSATTTHMHLFAFLNAFFNKHHHFDVY